MRYLLDTHVVLWWYFDSSRLTDLPIRAEDLVPLRTLPPIHQDPFDRLLVCQSLVEKIPLISYDGKVNAYFATM